MSRYDDRGLPIYDDRCYDDDLYSRFDRNGSPVYDDVKEMAMREAAAASWDAAIKQSPPPQARTVTLPIFTTVPCLFDGTSDKRCGTCSDCRDLYR